MKNFKARLCVIFILLLLIIVYIFNFNGSKLIFLQENNSAKIYKIRGNHIESEFKEVNYQFGTVTEYNGMKLFKNSNNELFQVAFNTNANIGDKVIVFYSGNKILESFPLQFQEDLGYLVLD